MKRYKLKELIEKYKKKRKLRDMDRMWRLYGGNCFGGYPPSYYYTHTPEEIKQKSTEQIERLKAIIQEYTDKMEQKCCD